MFTETMLLQVGRLMCCLLVTAVTRSQADLKFSNDRMADSIYCGQLQCLADFNEFDTRVLSIVELSIYGVIQANLKVKLASVSMFDPNLFVERSKVNALNVTGSVSRYQGDLTLSLRDVIDCLYGTFTCELNFLNRDIQADVISNSTIPDLPAVKNGTSPVLNSQLTKIEAELTNLRTQTTVLAAKLDSVLGLLSKPAAGVHQTDNTYGVSCRRGVSSMCLRERFLLWGTIPALCDTETDDGGWVIIQRRTKGDVDFYRNWTTYKKGFGTPDTDFWIGNDNIHNLTSQGFNELRIDMEYKGGQLYARYSNFSMGDEVSKYRLSISGYCGTEFDSMAYYNGMNFSTFDRDNDDHSTYDCATNSHGAWWYASCRGKTLNGVWGEVGDTGVSWYTHSGSRYLSWTEMKVRHV